MSIATTFQLPDPVAAPAALPDVRSRVAALAARTPDIAFEVVSDRDALAALGPEWNDLFERVGRPAQMFQTFNWIWHWYATFGADQQLAVVTGRRYGRLVVVWPLALTRSHGLSIAAWAGAPVSQYGDVVIDNDAAPALEVLAASWSFIARELAPDVLRLAKVRADASVAPLMKLLGARVSLTERAPYLDLTSAPTAAAYEERFSTKAKRNRRRYMRRLEERGPVSVERFAEGPAAASRVGVAMALKRAWLRDRGRVSAAFADERFERFFAAVAADAARPTGVRISALTTNGEIAATEIAFACKGHLAVHVIAYNLKFEKLSTGSLLIEASIRRAREEGIATFDFLAPGDDYKLEWADGVVAVEDLAVPLSLKGSAYAGLYLGWVRPRLKRAVTSMPLALRRSLSGAMSLVAALFG